MITRAPGGGGHKQAESWCGRGRIVALRFEYWREIRGTFIDPFCGYLVDVLWILSAQKILAVLSRVLVQKASKIFKRIDIHHWLECSSSRFSLGVIVTICLSLLKRGLKSSG